MKKISILFAISLFVITSVYVYGQSKVAKYTVGELLEKYEFYKKDSIELAIKYANAALDLATSEDDQDLKISADFSIAEGKWMQGDPAGAFAILENSLMMAEMLSKKETSADIRILLGKIHQERGEKDLAIKFTKEARATYGKLDKQHKFAEASNELGKLFLTDKDDKNAEMLFNSALEYYYKVDDKLSVAEGLAYLGDVCLQREVYEKAVDYFTRAKEVNHEFNNHQGVALNYMRIGQAFAQLQRSDEAIEYLKKSLAIYEKLEIPYSILLAKFHLGNILCKGGFWFAGIKMLDEGYKETSLIEAKELEMDFLYALAMRHEESNSENKALVFYKKYALLKDSLHTSSRNEIIERIRADYEFASQDEENVKLKEEMESNARTIIIVSLIVALLALATITLWVVLKRLKRANTKLNSLNKVIVDQADDLSVANKDIKYQAHELKKANDDYVQLNKKLEEQVASRTNNLVETNNKLNTAISELDTFLYKSSHDLRGPVATLLGLFQLYELQEMKSDALNEIMLNVKFTAEKMDRQVRNLKYINLIKDAYRTYRVDVDELLRQTLDSYSSKAHDLEVSIGIESVSYIALMRCELFKLALGTVVDNAIFYASTNQEGTKNVNIKSNIEDGTVKILVTDSGPGIPLGMESKIYDMYFKGNIASPGNGLGLYLAKKAIDEMGGELGVKRRGATTEFYITVPFTEEVA